MHGCIFILTVCSKVMTQCNSFAYLTWAVVGQANQCFFIDLIQEYGHVCKHGVGDGTMALIHWSCVEIDTAEIRSQISKKFCAGVKYTQSLLSGIRWFRVWQHNHLQTKGICKDQSQDFTVSIWSRHFSTSVRNDIDLKYPRVSIFTLYSPSPPLS